MNEHRSFFGDAERAFLLTPDLIIELERKTGAGIGGLSRRFFAGEFSYRELTEVIRLGLIGCGTDPEEAAALISTYAARMAVTELYALALPIIETVMFGKTQPAPKKSRKASK